MSEIIDSKLSPSDVLAQNPEITCPPRILQKLGLVAVDYIGFDERVHSGQIIVEKSLLIDVREFFYQARKIHFPINKVVPAAAPDYSWDDEKLMEDNASSGFNYRLIAGTNKPSFRALGRALDINPRQNPHIRYEDGKEIVKPDGAVWNPDAPGTFHAEHPLVHLMEGFGWEWGGNWAQDKGRTDYQHFQKTSS